MVDAASCELGVIVSLLPFCAETKNEWNCAFTHRYAFIEKKTGTASHFSPNFSSSEKN